jgi:hypothetical protein
LVSVNSSSDLACSSSTIYWFASSRRNLQAGVFGAWSTYVQPGVSLSKSARNPPFRKCGICRTITVHLCSEFKTVLLAVTPMFQGAFEYTHCVSSSYGSGIPAIGLSRLVAASHQPSCQFLPVKSFSNARTNPSGCIVSSMLNGTSEKEAKADMSKSGSVAISPAEVLAACALRRSSWKLRDTLFSALIVLANGTKSLHSSEVSAIAAPMFSRSWTSCSQSSGFVHASMYSYRAKTAQKG